MELVAQLQEVIEQTQRRRGALVSVIENLRDEIAEHEATIERLDKVIASAEDVVWHETTLEVPTLEIPEESPVKTPRLNGTGHAKTKNPGPHVCVCGREFENANKHAGHRRWCPTFRQQNEMAPAQPPNPTGVGLKNGLKPPPRLELAAVATADVTEYGDVPAQGYPCTGAHGCTCGRVFDTRAKQAGHEIGLIRAAQRSG